MSRSVNDDTCDVIDFQSRWLLSMINRVIGEEAELMIVELGSLVDRMTSQLSP